jgi:hypothetical protein
LSARACTGSANRTSTPAPRSSRATQRQPQGRLDRDRRQPAVPLGKPTGDRLARRRQTRLDQLTAPRVERHRLEHVLMGYRSLRTAFPSGPPSRERDDRRPAAGGPLR